MERKIVRVSKKVYKIEVAKERPTMDDFFMAAMRGELQLHPVCKGKDIFCNPGSPINITVPCGKDV